MGLELSADLEELADQLGGAARSRAWRTACGIREPGCGRLGASACHALHFSAKFFD
jgi:hypothetical protein